MPRRAHAAEARYLIVRSRGDVYLIPPEQLVPLRSPELNKVIDAWKKKLDATVDGVDFAALVKDVDTLVKVLRQNPPPPSKY
ncbi:MAG TPA: hypothetical protein VHT03_07135 [Rhizomicrobium sp.]|jgi:hypothetical protein|nr:hypothetical protein [Rhizomicrobium sp.]